MYDLLTPAGGFMLGHPDAFAHGAPPSVPLMQRFDSVDPEVLRGFEALERGEFTGDVNQLLASLYSAMNTMQRGITSATSALPIRENLEAELTVLVPQDTPLRNRIPRVAGSGSAAAWRQVTSLGGGWGSSLDQGGGGSAAQIFFAESGAPAELTTAYASKSASYKLMGALGGVTGFAMAAGRNFQDQYQTERGHAIMNLMLNEENALTNGDSTSTAAPWGDGSNALAFAGLVNLTATGNGVPSGQVQTSVGALTFAHIDDQLTRIWKQGGRKMWMLLNATQVNHLVDLAAGTGTMHRIVATGENNRANVGLYVTGYVHPVTGEVVDILVSRFLAAGTMLFGADFGPDGRPTLQVDVLPQVQLPELAPNQQVQGYVAQELAPTASAPQVYKFLVSVFEVLKMKNALCFAKSTGVTAPA